MLKLYRYTVAALALTFVIVTIATLSIGQEKKSPVIRYYGHSWFVLETTDGTKIAFDPHAITEYGLPEMEVDVVLISHPHNDHDRYEVLKNAETVKKFYGTIPKGKKNEWNEVKETIKGKIKIRSVGLYHDDEGGAKRGKTSAMIVEADGLTFCHLGDLGHKLSEEQIEAIGPIDVLMIPVGGIFTINGDEAKDVVKQLKPKRYIFPMHYGTKDYPHIQDYTEFLDKQKDVRKLEDSNDFTIPLDVKPERPTIITLNFKPAK
ncbi:MAG: MBL fold metallo-hydrolase [Gemmataceae bacterium]|jgi:L-ascorbate metabolism protein UlaG (beta-lactamase superfamily)|nr:MBL fold metallo-hydrolase [Gemmataceae bacterium]